MPTPASRWRACCSDGASPTRRSSCCGRSRTTAPLRDCSPAPSSPPILQRPKSVRTALAALERGETETALEGLLEAATSSNGEVRDSIRRAMIGIFGELGDDNPLSVSYRKQLARALY